jgi:NAD(P)-dependent dehydrogenase (short-subunit alcohol dehydrogenase family)
MLDRKVAIVTGGARGIGLCIARKFAAEGYLAVRADIMPEENVAELAIENTAYIQGDISTDAGRKKIVNDVIGRYGRIDVLVNNAGVAPRSRLDIMETTEESFDFVVGINLKGTFFLTQLVAREMVKLTEAGLKPKIVNISSMSAYTSSYNRGEYCISKAGVSMVTQLFADKLSEYGINVNEVRPGIIKTDMTATVTEKYDRLIFEEKILPLARWGTPEDVAEACFALCSDGLNYVTGQVINADGGFHMRRL